MTNNETNFSPPDDKEFQGLMLGASKGDVPVYGVVISTEQVTIQRSFEKHHPENTEEGNQVVKAMFDGWQNGSVPQPWLYVRDGSYIVADDYFWLALIEKGRPESFAAQVLGEPLKEGIIQKVGPLPTETVRQILGQS